MAALPRIVLDVPEQPPPGSIVLGRNGLAWQRGQDGQWYVAASGSRGIAWPELLAAQLDVVLLHVPDQLHETKDAGS